MLLFRTVFLLLLLLSSVPVQAESLQDLAKLQRDTNAGRLEALQEILKARGVPFEIQTFDGGGSNVVVTFGAKDPGAREIVVGAHPANVERTPGVLLDLVAELDSELK